MRVYGKPITAISRYFFPSQTDVARFFVVSFYWYPGDYGGVIFSEHAFLSATKKFRLGYNGNIKKLRYLLLNER